MRRGRPVVSIGIVSLITVFTILLLAVFSVLSLSGSRSDSVLSDRAARAVSDYYRGGAGRQSLQELSAIAAVTRKCPCGGVWRLPGSRLRLTLPIRGWWWSMIYL